MPEDLEAAITSSATGPAKASSDAGSVEQHKLTDLIEADRYLAGKAAAKTASKGLRWSKLVPPGAV
jgi:hypothetical protein